MAEDTIKIDVPAEVRWMDREKDEAAVLGIEHESSSLPWKRDDFADVLHHIQVVSAVATMGGRTVGYVIFEVQNDRIYIVKLSVLPDYRRRQVATRLLQFVQDNRVGRKILEFDVRESSTDAHIFLSKAGFNATGVRRGFFKEYGEDDYTPCHVEDSYNFVQKFENQAIAA